MAYDEGLAQRVREELGDHPAVTERKMFGGLCFMVNGHMAVGITSEALMVRVGPHAYEEALAEPGARPMDFTGRPMKGMVFVDPGAVESDDDLATWVARGEGFAGSLPPK